MIVTVLGSSAKQTGHRECVSIMADLANETFLFDVGPGIVASFIKANRKMSDVDHLFLTHVHGDHISGFAYYIWSRNSECKSLDKAQVKKIKVYGYSDTIKLAKFMLENTYPGLKLLFDIEYVVMDENYLTKASEGVLIRIVPAVHAVPTYSIIIEFGDKKMVYSSDTIYSKELEEYAENANLLIHEAMFTNEFYGKSRKSKHSTTIDAANFAEKTKAEQLVLVHILPSMFGKEGTMLEEIYKVYKGHTSIPTNGTVYYI